MRFGCTNLLCVGKYETTSTVGNDDFAEQGPNTQEDIATISTTNSRVAEGCQDLPTFSRLA